MYVLYRQSSDFWYLTGLTEPDAGRILVDGEDTSTVDPVQLRLKMGYVIQQTGLFPHLTVGQNVATVTRLWDWDSARIRARVEELLQLVGLDNLCSASAARSCACFASLSASWLASAAISSAADAA